ncbi:glycosyltransferase family 2 protein, partial [Rosenbergiella collisarenosi]|uniref:glycosyltransferase family 2 protein n=1 Tax=Rosenbergiella collisarenosi TaxID=1544695 RepID=UPI001F4F2791
MKLSIIVPVYNTSEYIDAFCDNLFPQLDECTEVIFVDDGSYDDSINKIINKCNNYCCDSAVKIISQVNRGLSAARNNGIKNSSGDYITFIDSDDYVSTQYIETIISNIDDSVDLLTFNANVVDNKGLFLRKLDIVKKQSDNSEEVFYDIFNLGRWYAWCRVFNKKLIKDDFFPNGKRFEDLMSIPTLYRHCNK